LLEYDPATRGVRGALAESWETSADGKTYTFTLRDDVKFHDGSELNAEAVKFSWERLGAEDSPALGYYGMIEEIEVVDSLTLKLTLIQAFPPFLSLLAGLPKTNFVVVSPTAVEEYGDLKSNLVGTGPYKFVEWIKDQSVEFVRNEDYWREKPPFGKLVIQIFSDTQTAKLAVEKGEIDLLYDGLGITPATDIAAFEQNTEIAIIKRPQLALTSVHYWLEDPDRPTANINLRKAIAHAINYDAVINELYGGYAQLPRCYIPDDLWSFKPVLDQYNYDMDKAKMYMEQAKQEGITTPLNLVAGYYSRAAIRRDTFLLMQEDLQELGIEIEIIGWELAAWMETYSTGPWDFQISAWSPLYLDPHGYATHYLEESIPYPNNSHYRNPEFEDLVQQALETQDQSEREAIYEQCWDILAEDLPVRPIWIPYNFFAVRTDINMIEPYMYNNLYLYGVERMA